MKYKWSARRDGRVWWRIIHLGVVGGPVAGGVLGVAFWAVAGLFGSFAHRADISQTVLFMVAGLVVGALVGLACGVCCSIVAATGYLITRKLGGTVRASISGVLAGAAAVALSYLAIGPVLAPLNPVIFAAVLGPTGGLAYFLVSFRRESRPTGRIHHS